MLHVVARRSLARFVPADGDRRLLLEGSWDENDLIAATHEAYALDDEIDARWMWLDAEAERLAERLIAECTDVAAAAFFHANVLRLRYACVKWLRVAAWATRAGRDDPAAPVTLHLSSPAVDDEYAAIWTSIAAAQKRALEIRRHDDIAPTAQITPPTNSVWRRRAANLVDRIPRRRPASPTNRVLLCGNPRVLGAVCDELLRRGVGVAWLFDRFAVRPWLRWGLRGVRMLTCEEPALSPTDPVVHAATMPTRLPSLSFDGIELNEVAAVWRSQWEPRCDAAQRRQRRRIAEHCRTFRPTHVVVDEDATPLPRLLLAAARDRGASTSVVQHGACGVRFGFAPLEAERIFAADGGSRRQLVEWNVDPKRIVVTGSPARDEFIQAVQARSSDRRSDRRRSVLVLGTTPARDARPDAVTYRLTSSSYEAMLVAIIAAAAERDDVELVLRAHPRTDRDSILDRVCEDFPTLSMRRSSPREQLVDLTADADVVVSCASSAGIDAALAGRPVIQMLPPGSGPVLPAEWYGLLGSARSLDDLRPLLARALGREFDRHSVVIGPFHAARRIVDAILPGKLPTTSAEEGHVLPWEPAHA